MRQSAAVRTVLYLQYESAPLGTRAIYASWSLAALRACAGPPRFRIRVATRLPALFQGQSDLDLLPMAAAGEPSEIDLREQLGALRRRVPTAPDLVLVEPVRFGWYARCCRALAQGGASEEPPPAAFPSAETVYLGGPNDAPRRWRPAARRWEPLAVPQNAAAELDLGARVIATLTAAGLAPPAAPGERLVRGPLRDAGARLLGGLTTERTARRPVVALNPHGIFYGGCDLSPAWAELLRALAARDGDVVVLGGTPASAECAGRVRAVREAMGPAASAVRWAPPAQVEDLLKLLAAADAVVSVQSGPAHLAEALGVPTVVWALSSFGDGYLPPDGPAWRRVVLGPEVPWWRADDGRGIDPALLARAPVATLEALQGLLAGGPRA